MARMCACGKGAATVGRLCKECAREAHNKRRRDYRALNQLPETAEREERAMEKVIRAAWLRGSAAERRVIEERNPEMVWDVESMKLEVEG